MINVWLIRDRRVFSIDPATSDYSLGERKILWIIESE
jgi:hypothetical protein